MVKPTLHVGTPTAIDSNSYSHYAHTNPQVEVECLTGVCAEGEGGWELGYSSYNFYHFPSDMVSSPHGNPLNLRHLWPENVRARGDG